MTTRSLVALLFFMVAGGPYGLEELLAKVGPAVAIVVLVVTPVLWSLPTALMVGELAAAIPEEGGFYVWVKRAMGPFLGFQAAWLALAASVFDMAIYPTLFVSYLARVWPLAAEKPWSLAIGVALLAACALVNLWGGKAVGDGAVAMTVVLLLPFGVLSVLLLLHGPAETQAVAVSSARSDILGGILVAMWNTMGWDNASTVAGEVDRPAHTYPRAVLLAVLLVTLTYLIPTVAVALAGVDVSAWRNGAWVDLGASVGGSVLRGALIFGGLLCGFGMCNALVLSYSRLPVALANAGHLPASFARLSAKGAPTVAIVTCSVAWTLSLGLEFERLVALDILLYGSALSLELIALVVLRIREPELARPYRVPGRLPGAVLLGVPPVVLLGVALLKNAGERAFGINALVFGLLVMALGAPLYFVSKGRFAQPAQGDDGQAALSTLALGEPGL